MFYGCRSMVSVTMRNNSKTVLLLLSQALFVLVVWKLFSGPNDNGGRKGHWKADMPDSVVGKLPYPIPDNTVPPVNAEDVLKLEAPPAKDEAAVELYTKAEGQLHIEEDKQVTPG